MYYTFYKNNFPKYKKLFSFCFLLEWYSMIDNDSRFFGDDILFKMDSYYFHIIEFNIVFVIVISFVQEFSHKSATTVATRSEFYKTSYSPNKPHLPHLTYNFHIRYWFRGYEIFWTIPLDEIYKEIIQPKLIRAS